MKKNAVEILIAVTVVAFLVQGASNGDVVRAVRSVAAAGHRRPFLLSDLADRDLCVSARYRATSSHLLFNMLGVWMFGVAVERYVGALKRLLRLLFRLGGNRGLSSAVRAAFVGCAAGADGRRSGGVFGLLLAYAVMFPARQGRTVAFRRSHCRRGCSQRSTRPSSFFWA